MKVDSESVDGHFYGDAVTRPFEVHCVTCSSSIKWRAIRVPSDWSIARLLRITSLIGKVGMGEVYVRLLQAHEEYGHQNWGGSKPGGVEQGFGGGHDRGGTGWQP